MTVYIYGLYDPRNGNLRYIGKTISLKKRFYGHIKDKAENYKNHWIKSLKSLGMVPEMRVLETIENSNDEDWQERERIWISDSFNLGHPLTNLDSGGNSGSSKSQKTKELIRIKKTGLRHSEETKKKMGDARRGRKHSAETLEILSQKRRETAARKRLENPPQPKILRGHKNRKPISEETRQKLRDSHRGKIQSPETREKRSKSLMGRIQSESTREKIRIGHLGKPKPRKATFSL
jgi:hypothetical protein